MTSEETSGSSVNWGIPASGPSAALRKAALTSSRLDAPRGVTVRSARLPQGTGTRRANPVGFPFKSGLTSPTSLAAPVVVEMMFCAAARARRGSLSTPSTRSWLLV
jgi:hypothetical protein